MSAIRVLVVDDATVFRKVLRDVFAADPAIEVVGTAKNGAEALAKIEQLAPDLVTLDVEMPVMDGLEALKAIRKRWPKLPVVMVSTLTSRGAEATFDALALGASDYATKPSGTANLDEAIVRLRAELVPKVKALAARLNPAFAAGAAARAEAPPRPAARKAPARSAPEILAIGSSTGGPNALAAVLKALPAGFPIPVVVTQHMPPVFTKLLAERLCKQTALRVVEATDGQPVVANEVLVAPGDRHLTVVVRGGSRVVRLSEEPPEHFCRPAVDVMFRTCADAYGGRVLGVVLTGMGQDGTRGAESIRQAGGEVFVQDEDSSVVWGMPGSVASAGFADRVLPLAELGPALVRRIVDGRARGADLVTRRGANRP